MERLIAHEKNSINKAISYETKHHFNRYLNEPLHDFKVVVMVTREAYYRTIVGVSAQTEEAACLIAEEKVASREEDIQWIGDGESSYDAEVIDE